MSVESKSYQKDGKRSLNKMENISLIIPFVFKKCYTYFLAKNWSRSRLVSPDQVKPGYSPKGLDEQSSTTRQISTRVKLQKLHFCTI